MDFLKKHQELISFACRFCELVILGFGLYYANVQINDLRKVNAGQITLDITRDIYSDERYKNNPAIIRKIERNQPILKENKGSFDEEDLDSIIGEWDLIARLNQLDILPDDLVYSAFSFDILKAYRNSEIRKYITQTRVIESDEMIFADFEWIAEKLDGISRSKE